MLSTGTRARVAYFSMEIALDPVIPTYTGGLGILAGDFLRSAADLGFPMLGVTLAYRNGAFRQRLDAQGTQHEELDTWTPESRAKATAVEVAVALEGRHVLVHIWRYEIVGRTGFVVPVFLLDSDVAANGEQDRGLTGSLYGGDRRYRLCQETILGIGGETALRALNVGRIDGYHMNEGHSALLVAALLERHTAASGDSPTEALERVRRCCAFTTHTPLPAGHDRFEAALAESVLGAARMELLQRIDALANGELNMTYLALLGSHYVNGVTMLHKETSSGMFPSHAVHAITNGVHAATWTSPPFAALFDRHFPEWDGDNLYLRYAVGIPPDEVLSSHAEAKVALLAEVHARSGVQLDAGAFTIGFARRATSYKRMTLLFRDLARLRAIAEHVGPVQVVVGGKAHPQDDVGKFLIRDVFAAAAALRDVVRIVYVENYDMAWARALTSGVDLWLNTPQPPLEASGTSGMKAALNGVPSLSILDGWWIEGHVEGVTGWSIGEGRHGSTDVADAAALYEKLERTIVPMFVHQRDAYARVMRSAIALNGSFFNTQRMLEQYAEHAYAPMREPAAGVSD